MKLILASRSPRRRELLARLAHPFEAVASTIAERDPRPGEDPAAYAVDLARAKVADVAARFPRDAVLAADTVVAVDGAILGKPEDRQDAARLLLLLRGRAHIVVTGVAVQCHGEQRVGSVTSQVWMRDFSADEVWSYIDSGEPMDKAGAYAAQGLGGALVERVVGCYYTVVGLPLCLSHQLLSACGVVDQLVGPASCRHSRDVGTV